ncbi:sugar ABC transporter substrate-binding protein [Butyrivibrio sp. MC2013]|uniref:sugar ABC transporter substrate-binding protein n=1 Tax=Butyrivibrio sp. MC2013 TaxID=1280686 RepID=UPI00040B0DB8|nr:extracellular solute-binding protein [Butyrivibrio sp. MC2013]
MRIGNRIRAILSLVLILAVMMLYADRVSYDKEATGAKFWEGEKTVVKLWYDDDALTPYLLHEALKYNSSHRRVRMVPTLVAADGYLEAISAASAQGEDYPDLFVLTNDALEKAYLAGLAISVPDHNSIVFFRYPTAALNSVIYKGDIIAYPWYFETSALLYNKTYLKDAARDSVENEKLLADIEANGEGPSQGEEENVEAASVEVTDEEVNAKLEEMLPTSISDIIKFAENYNAPETVESVFKWDVSDIFYNYFMLGNYLNLGGSAGDDPGQCDIYNKDTIACMMLYQQLGQFFAIDSAESDYADTLQDFLDGKTVFTLATTDCMAAIKAARQEGNAEFEIGVIPVPAINDDYQTRTMSVTRCIAINGYSENIDEAGAVAKWLTCLTDDDFYQMTDKVSANKRVEFQDARRSSFLEAYETSVPMPKMIGTSSFWMQMEIALEKIWNGADPGEVLKGVDEVVEYQLRGKEVTLDPIVFNEKVSLLGDVEDN